MDQSTKLDFQTIFERLKNDDEPVKVQLRRVFSSALKRRGREYDLSDPERLLPPIQDSLEHSGSTFTSKIAEQDLLEFLALSAPLVREACVRHAQRRLAEATKASAEETLSNSTLLMDEAIQRLEERSPRACRVAELRLYFGLTIDETAKALRLSRRIVEREWKLVREWLREDPKRAGAR